MIDVEAFRRDGYAVLRQVIDPAHLRPFISVLERRVDTLAPGLADRHGLAHTHPDEPFERRLARLHDGHPLDNREWDPVLFCEQFRDLIVRPELTGALVPLLGEEITYQGNAHLRPYLPRHLDSLPWHQDAQFYGAGTEHLLWQMVQVWLPLVDVDADSGCLVLVPGSHRWGLLDGAVPGTDNVTRSSLNRQDAIYRRTAARVAFEPMTMVPMRRGDMLVFTNLLAHTGTENRRDLVRWSIDMRFEATAGSRPATDLERHGYSVMHQRIHGRGYVPLRVRGAAGPQSWHSWRQARAATRPAAATA
ncbi:phytanoyl-CoA dioxygenase family protein [Catellatospora sichuanensis]|uniref:phytanoyl-CoA dioxygenase family protein n=1 Tax=Catellatospora sichuanensis TaxID=1969805 RepID=UPI001642551E|nr:phytanoyl-CoA dioxygenase family protein [Catellatospora sichuanensis]